MLLLLASTVITYASARCLPGCKTQAGKKGVLLGCLVVNFGILFVFKYFNFAAATAVKVLRIAGVGAPDIAVSLLLPVGISFYIFQAVSYLVDVYRGDLEPEKNFFLYALFVSFFPQLVAGPIERSKNLMPQIRGLKDVDLWNGERLQQGFAYMLYGYFLKMVIADRAAIFVDSVFDVVVYSSYGSTEVFLAMVLFTLQIYCDFAGYTYIAIGCAKILGVELMGNFNTPYFAQNIKDFWDRWHISLSTWFRDYVYFPLGGSRKGKLRKYLNILIVFGLSGLWHGAGWHFVAWGGLHGIYRVAGEASTPVRKKAAEKLKIRTDTFSFRFGKCLTTFFMVAIAWIFFRAESLRQAAGLLWQMVSRWNPWVWFDGSLLKLGLDDKDFHVLVFAVMVLFAVSLCRLLKGDPAKLFVRQNGLWKGLVFYVGILFVVIFGIYGVGYEAGQFIYFQF